MTGETRDITQWGDGYADQRYDSGEGAKFAEKPVVNKACVGYPGTRPMNRVPGSVLPVLLPESEIL